MKVGYARELEQNASPQETLMKALGVEKIFIDRASGKNAARPQLQAMLAFVCKGDVLVVESYSRLARSTRDLLSIVYVLKEKGVGFESQKESINTDTPAGQLYLTFFAGLYQFEGECLKERQAEGIREAKNRGAYKSRSRIDVAPGRFKAIYNIWKKGAITARAAQKALNLKPRTFYRRVAEYEGRLPNK